jgi:hypothetical protein
MKHDHDYGRWKPLSSSCGVGLFLWVGCLLGATWGDGEKEIHPCGMWDDAGMLEHTSKQGGFWDRIRRSDGRTRLTGCGYRLPGSEVYWYNRAF